MHIVEVMNDQESKLKKTRRGKRCGSRRTRKKTDEHSDLLYVNISTENKKSEKCRRVCVRPRHSPKAPHNSTQFLMEDRHQCLSRDTLSSSSTPGSEDRFYSCCDMSGLSLNSERNVDTSPPMDVASVDLKLASVDARTFMTNDFESFYNELRTEELCKLSKDDLVLEVLSLHDRLSSLEERVHSSGTRSPASPDRSRPESSESLGTTRWKQQPISDNLVMSNLQAELERLKTENQMLKIEKQTVVGSCNF